MMKWSVVLGVSFWVMGLMPSEVGPAYPNNNGQSFLPKTVGGKPDCVQNPRDTYCTDIKNYPKERILYLLENKMFDLDSMLTDESRDSYIFESRDATHPGPMYSYDPVQQTFESTRPKYGPPTQSYGPQMYKPPSQSYGPPPPALPSAGYLPPQYNNYTTSKPFHHPPPPPQPPPTKYGTPHQSSYGGSSYHYGTPAPAYDNEGPYPRYRKTSTTPSSYLTRYLPPPPPRAPPKPQPWWRKVMRTSRRRQKRQLSSTELCPYDEGYLTPKAGLSTKNQWMFIVNLDDVSDQYTQAVQTKKCSEGASCSGSCIVPDGFTSICQTQYVQKRLIALNGAGSSLCQELFWFPACCLCTIVPTG